MGDEPAVGANYWSATLPQQTRLIFRENKMQMRSVPLSVALQPFVFPAGEAIVLGLYTVWLSLTHSETLQLKAAFPRGSTRLVKLLLLVSENRHFSSSKAHFHVLPQSWNIKRRCFLQHTNQPAKSFRPICWVCLCFFPSPDSSNIKSRSAVVFVTTFCFLVELSAPSLEACVYLLHRTGWLTWGSYWGGKHGS